MRRADWSLVSLVCLSIQLAPAAAAVRHCATAVTGGPQTASTIGHAQRLAIAAWAKAAGVADGERHGAWRLAQGKALRCGPAADSGVACEASGTACMLQPAVQPLSPKVVPVTPPLRPSLSGSD